MRRTSWKLIVGVIGIAAIIALIAGCGGPNKVGGQTRPATPTGTGQPEQPAQPQAAPIAESGASAINITAAGAYSPTWVIRVNKCDLSTSNGSLVCNVVGGTDTSAGQYGGVKFKVGSVKAVAVDVTFTNPQNVAAAFMDLTVGDNTKQRVRWDFILRGPQHMPSGKQSFTFRPDKGSGGFLFEGGPATMDKVTNASFFIRVAPKSTAGFQLHRMVVER